MDVPLIAPLDTRLRGEIGQLAKGRDELGPTVGVATVIDRVHADEEVARSEYFCPTQSDRQKNRVACGNVGDRNTIRQIIF